MNFCTIVTKKFLSQARVLTRSIHAVHPEAQVYVLIADRVDGAIHPATEPFHTVQLADLGHAELIEQMAFYYNFFEFCCAVRGFFHEYMWTRTQADSWVYLDSDIMVVGDMSDIFHTLSSFSLLLNPHNVAPSSDVFLQSSELSALRHGVFNAGFVGLRRSDEAARFITWFQTRLARFCLEHMAGYFVDQLWLNHVPYYFDKVAVYTNPGANLAHWNLFQREVTGDAHSGYRVDGEPLKFVHFSGWQMDDPGGVSRHAPAYRDIPREKLRAWFELADRYRAALLANGFVSSWNLPYAFDHFDNGTLITSEMRYRHYKEIWSGVPQQKSPFARGEEFAVQ